MRQFLREMFTGIGGPDATPARLRVAAVLRFALVGPETARLLGDTVRLEPAGELMLKGVSAPVAAAFVAQAAPPY